MKKIIIMLLLIMAMTSCTFLKKPYEKMEEYSAPLEIEYKTILNTYEIYATHYLKLNEEQVLYYVPEIVSIKDEKYINKYYGYLIQTIKKYKNSFGMIVDETTTEFIELEVAEKLVE